MRYEISPDKHILTLTIDDEERESLILEREESEAECRGLRSLEREALEGLIANSELCWVRPEHTGDLTDAPLLGIYGDEVTFVNLPVDRVGETLVGCIDGVDWFQPIIYRWGYEPYQIRSFVDDLIEHKKAVFIDQW